VRSENTYTYSYNIRSRQVLAKMKVAYAYTPELFPYISLGVGPAFNSAANFVTSAPPLVAMTRQFANHTQTSFSYAIGVGVDCALTEQTRLGAGYQFVNFGKSQLGNATIHSTSVSGSLSQSKFYANELVAQLTLLLDHKPSKSDSVKWS
jgi:opacity protein-like surface antigen